MEKYLIPVVVVLVALLIWFVVLPKLGVKLAYEQSNFEEYKENLSSI